MTDRREGWVGARYTPHRGHALATLDGTYPSRQAAAVAVYGGDECWCCAADPLTADPQAAVKRSGLGDLNDPRPVAPFFAWLW